MKINEQHGRYSCHNVECEADLLFLVYMVIEVARVDRDCREKRIVHAKDKKKIKKIQSNVYPRGIHIKG